MDCSAIKVTHFHLHFLRFCKTNEEEMQCQPETSIEST